MDHASERSPLTFRQRLSFLLALNEREVDTVLRGEAIGLDAMEIATRVNLTRYEVNRLLSSRIELENYRMNPNRISWEQIQRIPGLTQNHKQNLTNGRPYFSMDELEAATQLGFVLLNELFAFPALEFNDEMTGRRVTLTPVFGRYLLNPRLSYEDAGLLKSLGFVEQLSGTKAPVRLVLPSEFEELHPPHELKAAFGGQVFPVLRDSQGLEKYIVPGSLDVWFRRTVSPVQSISVLNQLKLRVKSKRPKVGYYLVELQDRLQDYDITIATLEKINEANKHPDILFAEPDAVGFEDFTPDEAEPALEFEDASTGNRSWNLEAIELDAAHKITKGSSKVTIFVIDSGLKLSHPDLKNALRSDWNALDLNFDSGVPESEMSPKELMIAHGTKVGGVVAGQASDISFGVQGVAPECPMLPIKISGAPLSQSYGLRAVAICEAISYLGSDQRGVINISWSTSGEHIGIREALIEASEKGFAIVTSAGNYRPLETQIADKPHYPSCYAFLPGDTEESISERRKIKGLCSVAAMNASNVKASYSYYGKQSVTISAPGGEVGPSGLGIFLASTPTNYAYGAGTSFAAPHVTGLIALIFSLDNSLSAQQTIELICKSATNIDLQNPAFTGMLGSGLINARVTLESLGLDTDINGEVLEDTTSPEVPVPHTNEPAPMAPNEPLNINTANFSDFVALPLIGEWIATKIIAYREDHGPFKCIWEFTLAGVHPWTLEQLTPLIAVS